MIVLGVDFETTGLDVQKDRIIETGAVLWDTNIGKPLVINSRFCYAEDLPVIAPDAAAVHGLTVDFLARYAVAHNTALTEINSMASRAEAFVGHNCMQFDKPLYLAECERAQTGFYDLPWIDTCCDLKYPQHIKTRSLMYLAAEHGFLNPFAHRAVFDVLTMLSIFQKYDLVAALAYAQEPLVTLRACVSYDDRQKAKDRGYRWTNQHWLKNLRSSEVEAERRDAGFAVVTFEK